MSIEYVNLRSIGFVKILLMDSARLLEQVISISREAGAAIVETAGEGKYDLIVMGIKSQKGRSTAMLGRTVDYVLRNAPCRVWTITS